MNILETKAYKLTEEEGAQYFGMGHVPRQCPAYVQNHGECAKENHFKAVCKSNTSQPGSLIVQ